MQEKSQVERAKFCFNVNVNQQRPCRYKSLARLNNVEFCFFVLQYSAFVRYDCYVI